MNMSEETRIRDRCDQLWHALAIVLRVSMQNDEEPAEHKRAREWAVSVFGGDAETANTALDMALKKYVDRDRMSANQ
ncbi:hypothetical protein UFOVP1157_50 [uncultured Caudovirales phage]|uniref:Uncharacterized protein n=1 Tax=uncultured Caudovirales phage TaxID=2100421 RepID=A0A6J5MK59_9CAUD|nr:hypothetical protein UFOVP497_45 [uncultured Caudovirales phage]CAB4164354.1 hypothetical protein UFOVP834_21 [uncultured Caudovirales phage]CAB4172393.1 hypothetical protein UFOVP922_50 [uncultured Caudovirales phage]CAB4177741.1 hypothetical protein UFOVP1006_43 [uncultured Caudovirales phage]CAB4184051.1 hypothetical protein UFOVP1096_37 [uncultured Caudovirales phage]